MYLSLESVYFSIDDESFVYEALKTLVVSFAMAALRSVAVIQRWYRCSCTCRECPMLWAHRL